MFDNFGNYEDEEVQIRSIVTEEDESSTSTAKGKRKHDNNAEKPPKKKKQPINGPNPKEIKAGDFMKVLID